MSGGFLRPAVLHPVHTARAGGRVDAGGVVSLLLAKRWPVACCTAAVLVACWQGGVAGELLPVSVSSPIRAAAALADLVHRGELIDPVARSLARAGAGFVLAVLIGTVAGLASGISPVVEDLVDPPLSLTSAMPKIALFPVLAVMLGFDDRTRIAVIVAVGVYPVYSATCHGVRAVGPQLLQVARNCGASRVETLIHVVVPAALPRLLAGARIALALAFVMVFATEVVGFAPGLGSLIYRAYLAGEYPRMYAGIIVLGALGAACDRAFLLVAPRLVRG